VPDPDPGSDINSAFDGKQDREGPPIFKVPTN